MSDCAWCHEPVDCEHMAYVRDDERTYHDYCYPLALARELDEARALLARLRDGLLSPECREARQGWPEHDDTVGYRYKAVRGWLGEIDLALGAADGVHDA